MTFITLFLGVVFSLLIIGGWVFVGYLSYSLYSTALDNHYEMRMFHTIAVLNVMQAILGLYFICTGDGHWQGARWVAFSLIEIAFLSFVLRAFTKRRSELKVRTLFYVLILVASVNYSIILNVTIAMVLAYFAYINPEPIIKKHFTRIFMVYSLTSIVPYIFGYTTTSSLFIGVIFTMYFAYGAKLLYDNEGVGTTMVSDVQAEVLQEHGGNHDKR